MLKGISPLLSPELLATLCRMGHGDKIVLADAHFPADSCSDLVIRADGLQIPELLDAILPLFELDTYVEAPVEMMAAVPGDELDPQVAADYFGVINKHRDQKTEKALIERSKFYEVASEAFAVVATGDVRKYGNIILTKGVTPLVD